MGVLHPLAMANMSAKVYDEAHNSLVSIMFTSFFHTSIVTLTFDLQNQKVHTLTMANMYAKFDEESQNGLVYLVHKLFSIFVYCYLDLWPLISKIKRVYPLTMANMYAKFDEEAHNGLVSILFTSLFPYMSIVTLTFDLENQLGSSSHHSENVCQVWWIGTQWFNFYGLQKIKALRTHGHTDRRNHSSVTISPPQCVARG